jgi:hypothetical protein
VFEYERQSGLFENLRLDLETRRIETLSEKQNKEPAVGDDVTDSDFPGNELNDAHTGLERAWLTDMQRFFDLFEDRKLSLDIFTVVEDGRLDARIKNEYPGIKSSYTQVQSDSYENRPDIKELPAREAMVEFMVRLSLQQYEGVVAPSKYNKEASQIAPKPYEQFVLSEKLLYCILTGLRLLRIVGDSVSP